MTIDECFNKGMLKEGMIFQNKTKSRKYTVKYWNDEYFFIQYDDEDSVTSLLINSTSFHFQLLVECEGFEL